MDCTLKRTEYLSTGIFGELVAEDESFTLFTLEHSYPYQGEDAVKATTFVPKLPPGTYTCQRGTHQLAGMVHPFETFEVMNVPGHTGILIHPGNTEADSSGCILVGLIRQGNSVLNSRAAFQAFMLAQDQINQFTLVVE